jgi:hypothetical protein
MLPSRLQSHRAADYARAGGSSASVFNNICALTCASALALVVAIPRLSLDTHIARCDLCCPSDGRLRERYPEDGGNDYIFFSNYRNRSTASRIFQRQFNALLERTDLKHDPVTDSERSVYSLRHTAICMRIILSHGKVNIFNLAKNAGTSVNQIERFCARNLPLSRELAKNLQSFGGE